MERKQRRLLTVIGDSHSWLALVVGAVFVASGVFMLLRGKGFQDRVRTGKSWFEDVVASKSYLTSSRLMGVVCVCVGGALMVIGW